MDYQFVFLVQLVGAGVLLLGVLLSPAAAIVARDLVLTPKQGFQFNGKSLYYVEGGDAANDDLLHKEHMPPLEHLINQTVNAASAADNNRPWERTLKHVTFVTLFTNVATGAMPDNISDQQGYTAFMQSPYLGNGQKDVRFGDIVTLASGRLEVSPATNRSGSPRFRFVEGVCESDCVSSDDIWALWQVQKIRHRDGRDDAKFHHEIRYSISPMRHMGVTTTAHKRRANLRDFSVRNTALQTYIQREDDYPKNFVPIVFKDVEKFASRKSQDYSWGEKPPRGVTEKADLSGVEKPTEGGGERGGRGVDKAGGKDERPHTGSERALGVYKGGAAPPAERGHNNITPQPQSTFVHSIYQHPHGLGPPPPPDLGAHSGHLQRLNIGEYMQGATPTLTPKIEIFPNLLSFMSGAVGITPTTYRPHYQYKFPKPDIYQPQHPYPPHAAKQPAPQSHQQPLQLHQPHQQVHQPHQQLHQSHQQPLQLHQPHQQVHQSHQQLHQSQEQLHQSHQQSLQLHRQHQQLHQSHQQPMQLHQEHQKPLQLHQQHQQPLQLHQQHQQLQQPGHFTPNGQQKFAASYPQDFGATDKITTPVVTHHFHHHFYTPTGSGEHNSVEEVKPGQPQQLKPEELSPQFYKFAFEDVGTSTIRYPLTTTTSNGQKYLFETDDIQPQHIVHVTQTPPLKKPFTNYSRRPIVYYSQEDTRPITFPENKSFLHSEVLENVSVRYSEPDPLYLSEGEVTFGRDAFTNVPAPQVEAPQLQPTENANSFSKEDDCDNHEGSRNEPTKDTVQKASHTESEIVSEELPETSTAKAEESTEAVTSATTSTTTTTVSPSIAAAKDFNTTTERVEMPASTRNPYRRQTPRPAQVPAKTPMATGQDHITTTTKLSLVKDNSKSFVSTSTSESPLKTVVSRIRGSGTYTRSTTTTTEQPVLKWKPRRKASTKSPKQYESPPQGDADGAGGQPEEEDDIKAKESSRHEKAVQLGSAVTLGPPLLQPDSEQSSSEIYEVLTQKSVSKSVSIRIGKDGKEIPIVIDEANVASVADPKGQGAKADSGAGGKYRMRDQL